MTETPTNSSLSPLPRALKIFAVVVVVAAAIVIPLAPTLQSGGGVVPIVLSDTDLAALPAVDRLPAGTALEVAGGPSGFNLVVDELPLGLSILTAVGTVLAGAVVAVAAWVLIRILLDIRRGKPFSSANPKRFGILAAAVLAGALLPQLANNVAAALVLDHLGIMGSAVPEGYSTIGYTIVAIDAASILLVVALIIMAEAFQHGQRLARDVEGLV